MSQRERRVHARVEVDLACTFVADEGESVEGRVADLSPEGARLLALAGFAQVGDRLSVRLDLGDGRSLDVLGEVIWSAPAGDRSEHYGVRFDESDPALVKDLPRFLEVLLDRRGIHARQAPRLYRRIELSCTSTAHFYATMTNISRGGMALECPVALARDDELTIELEVRGNPSPVALKAKVVHVRQVGSGAYFAGLRFSALTSEQEGALRAFLRGLTSPSD